MISFLIFTDSKVGSAQVIESEATETSNTVVDVATLKRRETIKRKVIHYNIGEFLSPSQDDNQTQSKLEERSNKRKADDDQEGTRKRRLRRRSQTPSQYPIQTSNGLEVRKSRAKGEARCEDDREGTRKSRRKSQTPSQYPIQTSDEFEVMKSSANGKTCRNSRVFFETVYSEGKSLGQGGFGEVFAGYRTEDKLPVAIKHIDQTSVIRTPLRLNGDTYFISLEAAMMFSAWEGHESTGNNPVIALLDSFDLDDELILVMERPVPCMDLLDYLKSSGNLHEHIAKDIQKQLVDAAIHMKSKGVFHRDLKLQNILIQTTSYVPRVKVIDFGCGVRFTQNEYTLTAGTLDYSPPEMLMYSRYKAEPTTVWQLGLLLYAMVHGDNPFKRKVDIMLMTPTISENLSANCRKFLESCLAKNPDDRPTLEELVNHAWLQSRPEPSATTESNQGFAEATGWPIKNCQPVAK